MENAIKTLKDIAHAIDNLIDEHDLVLEKYYEMVSHDAPELGEVHGRLFAYERCLDALGVEYKKFNPLHGI